MKLSAQGGHIVGAQYAGPECDSGRLPGKLCFPSRPWPPAGCLSQTPWGRVASHADQELLPSLGSAPGSRLPALPADFHGNPVVC